MSKVNFYETIKQSKSINPNISIHGISVPFRAIIAAPSGAGKTHALCNLILQMDKTFHEIIICVLSSDEPLYGMIEDRLGDSVKFYEGGEVPPLSDFTIVDPKTKKIKRKDDLQRLIVFDDLVLNKKSNAIAQQYYIKARKFGFSMLYISQSYFQTPKMIRDNCQIFILGKNLLKKDLRMILNVFPTDLSLDDFSHLYQQLTNEPLDTIVLDIAKRTLRRNIIGDPMQI